jgi:triacylglycerol lipase
MSISPCSSIPGPTPAMVLPQDMNLSDAQFCAQLVMTAYCQYQQWVQAGSPVPGSDVDWWNPTGSCPGWKPNLPPLSYSSPLWGNAEFLGNSNDEPFGFVATPPNDTSTIYVAFRGTSTDVDVWDDLDTSQTSYSLVTGLNFGYVHEGLYSIYTTSPVSAGGQNPLRTFLLNLIESYYKLPDAPVPVNIYFTGHSLGSALCTLAVPDVLYNAGVQVKQAAMYNFASPRVGDFTFACSMNHTLTTNALCSLFFRVVNTEDIVPTLPITDPSGLSFYEHVGTPVSFTAQYLSLMGNHSMQYSYLPAIDNPSEPQGPPVIPQTAAAGFAAGRMHLPRSVFASG